MHPFETWRKYFLLEITVKNVPLKCLFKEKNMH